MREMMIVLGMAFVADKNKRLHANTYAGYVDRDRIVHMK
jgi:hypothetical protein